MDHEEKAANALDRFLEHKTGTFGDRGPLLGNWKDDGNVVVWLHTRAPIEPIWTHNWPRMVTRKDRETDEETTEVWGGRWGCHEKEAVLQRQRFRNDEDKRDFPPEVCPICILIEKIREKVGAGELKWTDAVFKFEGDDPEKNLTITAGGAYNAFSKKDITNQEKAELRRAGIRRDEAWRESLIARCQFVFSVVVSEREDEGVQIAIEPSSLGDKMKTAIRDQIRALGKTDGNPLLRPYPFEWQYDREADFAKRYHVVALPKDKPSEEMHRLITESDPPDIAEIIQKGDLELLRAEMEEHACVEMPWDEIFEAADKLAVQSKKNGKPALKPNPEPKPDTTSPRAERKALVDEKGPTKLVTGPAKEEPKAEVKQSPNPKDELFECDHCKEPAMTANDFECPKCGAEYEETKSGQIVLAKRPCVHSGCEGKAPVNAKEPNTICEKCGTVISQEEWKFVSGPIPPSKPATRAASRTARR